MKRPITALMVLLACVAPLGAQPLADRVPSDAIAYLGWSGTEAMPGYAGTHAEALIQNSNLPTVFRQVLPQLIAKLQQNDPRTAEEVQVAYEFASLLTGKPTALFFSGIEPAEGMARPMPKFGLICRVGPDAEQVRAKLEALIDEANPHALTLVLADGEDVAVVVGYESSPLGVGGLAANDAFVAARSRVQSDPAFCFYFDVEKLFELIDTLAAAHLPPDEQGTYHKVVDALGVRGLKQIISTSGFEGKDWVKQTFVSAPAPREGLLSVLDGPPIGDDLLRAIPSDAELAVAGSFDPAQLVSELRAIAGRIDPQYQQFLDQGLGAAQMALGVNLLSGVLEPLGPHWAAYSAPSVSGGGLPGLVLINKPDSFDKARRGLLSVSILANNTAAMALRGQEITVQGRQTKVGDLAIHYIAAPMIAPSWAASGETILFGFYPQTLVDANRHLTGGGKSLLDNPAYQKLRDRLGQKDVRGVYFANLPATAPSSYQLLLVISRALGFADLFGIQTPAIVLPPYSVFAEHINASGAVTWMDDAGLHSKAVEPFPGASVFGGTAGGLPILLSQGAVAGGMLAPALARARSSADDARVMSDGRQLAMGILIHANENNNRLPADLEAVTASGVLPDDFFDRQTRTLRYLGDDSVHLNRIKGPHGVVLVYDEDALHLRRKVLAVFADGHAEMLDAHLADDVIERSRAALDAARD